MSFRAILGDCLEKMKDLSSNSVDLFLCDLPYGCLFISRGVNSVEVNSNGKRVIVNKPCEWDVKIDLEKFWEQVKRLAKSPHTPVLLFCTAKFGAELIASQPSWFHYDLIWEKTNAVGFLNANKQPMRSHESIYVFSKAGAYYNRIDLSGNFPPGGGGASSAKYLPISGMPNSGTTEAGRRCVKSVLTFANKKGRGNHPTQKPAELYEFLIRRFCPEGGTILDPTAGSFISCRVAQRLGRHAIGIEKSKDYFDRYSGTKS